MSDDLVARLRSVVELWTKGRNTSLFIRGTVAEAADRIEALEAERDELRAERDTLAEMVRRVNMRVFDDLLRVYIPSSGALSARVAPDQTERFQQVLDRISEEAETSD